MNRPRVVRYMRITFSAACLLACVLMIGLWVRSYWWRDSAFGHVNSKLIHAISMEGRIELSRMAKPNYPTRLYTGQVWHEDVEVWKIHQINTLPSEPTVIGFRLRRTVPLGIAVYLPRWFPVVLIASLAVLPWMRWRFSLRTLLLAATLVAVVLGMIVNAVK